MFEASAMTAATPISVPMRDQARPATMKIHDARRGSRPACAGGDVGLLVGDSHAPVSRTMF